VSDVRPEPASFRDPATRIFYLDRRVLRGLDATAAQDWEQLAATRFFPKLMEEGGAVRTTTLEPADVPVEVAGQYAAVIEHERIPFISYPYEWTFAQLRDAAILHLEILLAALEEDVTMKDGYAFNVQWRGPDPVFIDIGSFERIAGGPWIGYRQFCQTFLYPLLLEAHLGVSFQRILMGHLDGLDPTEMRRIFSGRKKFKKGVFRHVYLHSIAESRVTQGGQAIKEDLKKSGFSKELTKATVTKLLKLVRKLHSKRADSGWKAYRETCSYSDEDRNAKERFLREAIDGTDVGLAWDLGCNDGIYSRIVAERGGYVVAVDSDDVTVDVLYRSLREDGVTNILPLVMNLVDPSPPRGWRGEERSAFTDRDQPDLVLALALVHHLAIAANVPLGQVVAWFRSFGGRLIVEFVEPHDPMAQRLLGNKPPGMFPDYRVDVFEKLLEEHFTIDHREALPSGSRTLFTCTPR
jgi:SAM-dependent methyltransferase